MEWFRSSKQRKPVQPTVAGDVAAPELEPVAPAPLMTPKAKFDNPVLSEDVPRIVRSAMTAKAGFTIHSSRNGESNETQLTSPTLTVAKARMLFKSGWLVHITDARGRHFAPSQFDDVLKFD